MILATGSQGDVARRLRNCRGQFLGFELKDGDSVLILRALFGE